MTDKEIVSAFQNPESKLEAFQLVLKKYQSRIYWHIRKMVIIHEDADDLTQDSFVKVWLHLDSFRQDAKLFTWLYRIATNECLAFLEKKKRQQIVPIGQEEEGFWEKQMVRNFDSLPYISGDEIAIELQKAILQLPEKQRLVFNLRYFDDLSYEDISEITDSSVGALKANYHHATKKLESILAQL